MFLFQTGRWPLKTTGPKGKGLRSGWDFVSGYELELFVLGKRTMAGNRKG
jgi:hypothetical protein